MLNLQRKRGLIMTDAQLGVLMMGLGFGFGSLFWLILSIVIFSGRR